MPKISRHLGVALALSAALLGACGGDDDDSGSSSAGAENVADAAEDSSDDAGSSGASGSGDLPELPDGQYSQGTAHVEVSGDKDASYDLLGGGATTSGFSSFAFRDETSGATLALGWGEEVGDPTIAITGTDFATGGTIGKECSISFDKTEATGVIATFECKDMAGVGIQEAVEFELDAKGSFEVGA